MREAEVVACVIVNVNCRCGINAVNRSGQSRHGVEERERAVGSIVIPAPERDGVRSGGCGDEL